MSTRWIDERVPPAVRLHFDPTRPGWTQQRQQHQQRPSGGSPSGSNAAAAPSIFTLSEHLTPRLRIAHQIPLRNVLQPPNMHIERRVVPSSAGPIPARQHPKNPPTSIPTPYQRRSARVSRTGPRILPTDHPLTPSALNLGPHRVLDPRRLLGPCPPIPHQQRRRARHHRPDDIPRRNRNRQNIDRPLEHTDRQVVPRQRPRLGMNQAHRGPNLSCADRDRPDVLPTMTGVDDHLWMHQRPGAPILDAHHGHPFVVIDAFAPNDRRHLGHARDGRRRPEHKQARQQHQHRHRHRQNPATDKTVAGHERQTRPFPLLK